MNLGSSLNILEEVFLWFFCVVLPGSLYLCSALACLSTSAPNAALLPPLNLYNYRRLPMRYNIYAIFDSGTATYSTPFFSMPGSAARPHAPALRSVMQLLHDDRTTLAMHPEDYSLHHLGYWDDSGKLDVFGMPHSDHPHELVAHFSTLLPEAPHA